MKRIVVGLAFLCIIVGASAQTDTVRGNQYELRGTLKSEIGPYPGCGVVAFAVVLELEIIEFSKTDYAKDTVAVILTCPDFLGSNFLETNKTYALILADENQANFGWTLLNDELLQKYNLEKNLWVVKEEKLD